MSEIKKALISVWDKTNIIPLAKFLVENDVEIYSTGGTKKILQENKELKELLAKKEVLNLKDQVFIKDGNKCWFVKQMWLR